MVGWVVWPVSRDGSGWWWCGQWVGVEVVGWVVWPVGRFGSGWVGGVASG